MPATYQGHPVTVLRPAVPEDKAFKGEPGEVLVRLSDGTECVVPSTDMRDSPEEITSPSESAPIVPDTTEEEPTKFMALPPVKKKAKAKKAKR
jgi:hypothetical protein